MTVVTFPYYQIGNSLYNIALDLFLPTVFFFFAGATYRIGRYLITYKPPFNVNPSSPMRGSIGGGEKLKELYITVSNSSVFGIRRKPVTTAVGILMHIALILMIFLLAQHMVFWAYYFPPYSALFPLAIPESSEDGLLALTMPGHPTTTMSYTFVNSVWGPLTVILNGQILTYLLIIFLSIYLAHKFYVVAERLVIRAGDWWFFVLIFIDVVLGFLAASHIPNNVVWYDNILGAHILVAEIIIATLPFTRGFHMFEFWFGKLREWYFMTFRRGIK